VTVIAALWLLPFALAVMLALPATTPLTSPEPVVVATVGAELTHVTVGPMTVLPATSDSEAVSCNVFPSTTEPLAGEIETLFTGPAAT